MNTITAIITTIVLSTAIAYNASTPTTDETTFTGPPPTATATDTAEPTGPPSTFDGGNDTPVCLSCD